MKTALVLGGGGFIGNAMVSRLKQEGYWVRSVDLKYPEFGVTEADHFVIRDLREYPEVEQLIGYAGSNRGPWQTWSRHFDLPFDEIYQFAADMGGAGYIFTGEHDADIMHNSATINLNVLSAQAKYNELHKVNKTKIFYSSSACIYPAYNQTIAEAPECREKTAYPAQPDSEYGWEKLFSERLYASYARNKGIPVRVARYHNIYGPKGTWEGGREKAPAAICRKVIEARDMGEIEVWGDGHQTRSFLYIDDCIDATRALMESDFEGPVNIGSEEMVTINQLVDLACVIAGKQLRKKHDTTKPQGVRGRCSDNELIEQTLGWTPKFQLMSGLAETFYWIKDQIDEQKAHVA